MLPRLVGGLPGALRQAVSAVQQVLQGDCNASISLTATAGCRRLCIACMGISTTAQSSDAAGHHGSGRLPIIGTSITNTCISSASTSGSSTGSWLGPMEAWRHSAGARTISTATAAEADTPAAARVEAEADARTATHASASASASDGAAIARSATAAPGARRRFYKSVALEPAGAGRWQLLLGKHPVKTPAQNPLVLPSRALALAVAAEWEWLERGQPVMLAMPLMSLVATAIDQPKARARVVDSLLKYIHTDAGVIRYEPGQLQRRQAALFDPLLGWAAAALGWRLAVTDCIGGVEQDGETVAAVRHYLDGLDPWRLAAVEQLTSACKSLLLAAAVAEGRLDARAAVAAARLEEDFQLEDWGMVEAGHDLDIADTNTRVVAPALLLRLLPPAGAAARDGGDAGGGAGT